MADNVPTSLLHPPALLSESERLRYTYCTTRENFPGPGSYATIEGLADDKRRSFGTPTWSKGRTADLANDVPGPATYSLPGTLGEDCPNRSLSSRTVFGHGKRFPCPEGGGVHSYAGVDCSPPRLTVGTFSRTERSAERHSDMPAPQQYTLKGIADESAHAPQRRTAARFPEPLARSPGPVYSIRSIQKKGVRLPPKARQTYFQFLENTPTTTPTLPAARQTICADEKTPNGIRIVSRSGQPQEVLTSSGATLASGAFGRKTQRDTVFAQQSDAPGPQRYAVTETAVKRSAPAYSFGPQPNANAYEGELRRYFDDKKGARKKKPGSGREAQYQVEGQGQPGPGAYQVEGGQCGPSYSIATPLPQTNPAGPGPCAYESAYDTARKPASSTFARCDRFPPRPKECSIPGPGHYAAAKLTRKTQYKHGDSSTCPDVMGWTQKKRETERRHNEDMKEIHRRMVIMGTEDVEGKRLSSLGKVCIRVGWICRVSLCSNQFIAKYAEF